MNLKVIEKTDTEIKIEIIGESHTLLNTLKSLLLVDPDVTIATYDIKHPTFSDPVLYVKTDNVDPVATINEAAKRVIETYEEIKTVFGEKVDI